MTLGQQRGIVWAAPASEPGGGPSHLPPPSSHFLFCALKTELPIEKRNAGLQSLWLANALVPGSAGLRDELRLWAHCPGLSFATSKEPGAPAPPHFPAERNLFWGSCLLQGARCLWMSGFLNQIGETSTRMTHGGPGCAGFINAWHLIILPEHALLAALGSRWKIQR